MPTDRLRPISWPWRVFHALFALAMGYTAFDWTLSWWRGEQADAWVWWSAISASIWIGFKEAGLALTGRRDDWRRFLVEHAPDAPPDDAA